MELILGQLRYFSVSLLYGIGLMLVYDGFVVFRHFVKHGKFLLLLEDWLFWLLASLFVFQMVFEMNYGIIRSFFVISLVVGMVCYKKLVSKYIINGICAVISWIFRPYVWIRGKYRKKLENRKKKS